MCKAIVEFRSVPIDAFTAERSREFFASRPELDELVAVQEEDVEPSAPSFYSINRTNAGRSRSKPKKLDSQRNNFHHKERGWKADGARRTRRNARVSYRSNWRNLTEWYDAQPDRVLNSVDLRFAMN